jgi:NAD(P)-dependent dehydrogenase (short-subunit alcohol dehydrogenase family)
MNMIQDLFGMKNRVVIITGGSGLLGIQYCKALLEAGARIAIFDLNDDLELIQEKLNLSIHTQNLIACKVDITDKQSIKSGLDDVIRQFGTPHGLINNAALDSPPDAPLEENGPFETYPETSWDRVVDVNIKGTFLCCQIIGGCMAASSGGSIVNIGSIYGIVSPDQRLYEYRQTEKNTFYKPVAYSVSKSAIVNLTRYLATYWGKKNIRVNTLTIGGVFNAQDDEFLMGYQDRVPLGRMAKSKEYCGSIIFLLSEASSYMTGSNLVVDGGWTAW